VANQRNRKKKRIQVLEGPNGIAGGDRKTTYFQVVAHQRNREKRIEVLKGPNGIVEDDQGMMKIVVDCYKYLFKKENGGDVSLGENL
jgi:hypothetical protein